MRVICRGRLRRSLSLIVKMKEKRIRVRQRVIEATLKTVEAMLRL